MVFYNKVSLPSSGEHFQLFHGFCTETFNDWLYLHSKISPLEPASLLIGREVGIKLSLVENG